jgi:alpha-1,2-mannosyltransferase
VPGRRIVSGVNRLQVCEEPVNARRGGRRRNWWPLVLLGIGVVAFLARLLPTLQGGGLSGLGAYDDGVYYAAAASLVAGRVPYEQFVLLHPPGIAVALTPFAVLGRMTSDPTGFALARLAMMLLGAANAVLVAVLARRFGSVAAVVGGLMYALWFPAIYVEARTTLEPLGTTLVLVCLLLLPQGREGGRWGPFLAGVALGLAVSVKIWAVAPLAVIASWQLVVAGRRRLGILLGGAAAGAVVVCLPFLLLAPQAMVRMVVADQTGRPRMAVSTGSRLQSLLNVAPLLGGLPRETRRPILVLALALVLVAVALAWTQPGAWVFVLLLGTTTAILIASPSYFPHYGSFPAPLLALVVGVATAVARSRLQRRSTARIAVVVLPLVLVVGSAVAPLSRPMNAPFPGRALGALVTGRPCVVADDPNAAILMNTLSRDLAHGCTVPVDFTGATYDYATGLRAGGRRVPRVRNRIWQRAALRQLRSGTALVLVRLPADGLSPDTLARLLSTPAVGTRDGYTIHSG